MESIYIEIDGVKGESTTKHATNLIELLGFSVGVSMPQTNVTGGSTRIHGSRPRFSDLTITKKLDIATPTLHLKCSNGENIKSATLRVYANTEATEEVYRIKIEDVVVSGARLGSGGSDLPLETISLNFAKIEYTFISVQATTGTKGGNRSAKFDLLKNA
jgi:type VI secretion system secreted protein Hcp